MSRKIVAARTGDARLDIAPAAGGAAYAQTGYADTGGYNSTKALMSFDSSRVVPTGAANKPRAWGALACCYLGQPA